MNTHVHEKVLSVSYYGIVIFGQLRDVLFIVRAGSDIIKADFMQIKRTTFPTKMKTGIVLEELK